MSSHLEGVLTQALDWCNRGSSVVLATVINTSGSAPRPLGSQLAINDAGEFVGSVSGGCVEAAVMQAALAVMSSGQPERLMFGMSRDEAWEAGLPCGGVIEVYLQRARVDILTALVARVAQRRTSVWVTMLASGESLLYDPLGSTVHQPSRLHQAAARAAMQQSSALVDVDGESVFLQVFSKPRAMVVVGAVHTAQCLAGLALLHGFDVHVIDPRPAFAASERFPGVRVHVGWPDEVLSAVALDEGTALVTLAHDPRLDEPALCTALRSGAFYVGALGSKKTHQARLERLRAAGVSNDLLQRIHAPVGLHIGATTPVEIATSVMAQVIMVMRGVAS
jgi:xanthine dehydrogenase accessory factor